MHVQAVSWKIIQFTLYVSLSLKWHYCGTSYSISENYGFTCFVPIIHLFHRGGKSSLCYLILVLRINIVFSFFKTFPKVDSTYLNSIWSYCYTFQIFKVRSLPNMCHRISGILYLLLYICFHISHHPHWTSIIYYCHAS